jgi:peptidoglycan/xylan/chitin deacetylase (PgdA/CDA1 family)/CelD/BcsL family acetyltransferase involved in cellulose biosynthesis
LRIEHISSEKELSALKGEWNSLLHRTATETVFLTWEWLSSWWSAYGTGKQLFVLVARGDLGEYLGIAPLYVERPGRTRLLRFIGDGSHDSDYLDFIVLQGQEDAVLSAFFDYLKKARKKWDALQLNEIPKNSRNLEFMLGLAGRSRWLFHEEQVPCGIRSLPPTWEEFLQTLKPRFRTSVRACLRNLEQWHGSFEQLTNETDISSWLSTLYDLHSDRWALRQQSGVFARTGKREFYEGMTRSFFRQGWLHMTRWKMNDAVLACQFGFIYGGTYHLLQEGFDSRCIHVSPGVTLRAATFRDLIACGVHTYDFLGGMGRHKTDWGANEKISVRLALAPRTLAGHAYVTMPESIQNAKDFLKRTLPESLVQRLKPTSAARDKSARDAAAVSLSAVPPKTKSWKQAVADGALQTGLVRVVQSVSRRFELRPGSISLPIYWQKAMSPKFVVICYHRVGTGGVPLYSDLEPEVFEAQMRFLRNRYRIVSFDTLAEELSHGGPTEQSVAITFDDGYRDVYKHAFPVLQKFQIPATIYLTADAIESNSVAWYDQIFLALSIAPGDKLDLVLERPRRFLLPTAAARLRAAEEIISFLRSLPTNQCEDFCAKLERLIPLPATEIANKMLTWDQIREMQQVGVSFGSHTLTHPAVSRLEPLALERELCQSKAILEERLGVAVKDFAYPFGKPADYGNTLPAVARAGYRTASTTNWGINTPGVNLHELRRVSIGEVRRLSMFALSLAQLFLSSDLRNELSASVPATKERAVLGSS